MRPDDHNLMAHFMDPVGDALNTKNINDGTYN